jgi:hypothetical protein
MDGRRSVAPASYHRPRLQQRSQLCDHVPEHAWHLAQLRSGPLSGRAIPSTLMGLGRADGSRLPALDGDLRAWAQRIAAALRSKRGFAFFKVIVASASRGGARNSARVRAMEPRLKQIEAMLNRAHERGEQAPPVSEVLDHLLAPLYFHALFGAPADRTFAADLVDHLLRSCRDDPL